MDNGRMSDEELDFAAARLERLETEARELRSLLLNQVVDYGYTIPRSGEYFPHLLSRLYKFKAMPDNRLQIDRVRRYNPAPLFEVAQHLEEAQ